MLFNLAALHSREAARDKRSPEGLQKAYASFKACCLSRARAIAHNVRWLQIAAGIFEYISSDKSLSPMGVMSIDMSADSLGMLRMLMLAQAQACFFEKVLLSLLLCP